MSTDEQILGRTDVNDLEAILMIANTDVDEALHTVADNADAIFTWDYEKGKRPALNKLYEKAKGAQWNGETDLDWSIDVDQDALVEQVGVANGPEDLLAFGIDIYGTALESWGRKEWKAHQIETQNGSLSQFLHGE